MVVEGVDGFADRLVATQLQLERDRAVGVGPLARFGGVDAGLLARRLGQLAEECLDRGGAQDARESRPRRGRVAGLREGGRYAL